MDCWYRHRAAAMTTPHEVFCQVPPKHLYRYRSLADDRLSGFTEDIVLRSKLYWSSPLDFNDPFDFAPIAKVKASGLKLQRILQKVRLRRRRTDGRAAANAGYKNIVHLPRSALEAKLDAALRNTTSSAGVVCYAEEPDNILMWGHYADCHRGICLEFDPHVPSLDASSLVYKVRYQTQRPILANFLEREDSSELAVAITTKADFWTYEKEWRAIESSRARATAAFDPRMLTAIILGAKISEEREATVRSWVERRNPTIELRRAVLSAETYRLEIQPAL